MKKAEKFISEHTRKLIQYGDDYFLWITPDDARKAVEIERKEVIEKAIKWLEKNTPLHGAGIDLFRRAMEKGE